MKLEMMRDATYTGLEKFWVEDATELGFDHIPFPFLLLAGGIGVSSAIFLIEKIFGKRKTKGTKRKTVKTSQNAEYREKIFGKRRTKGARQKTVKTIQNVEYRVRLKDGPKVAWK